MESPKKKKDSLNDKILEGVLPETLQDLEEEHVFIGASASHSEMDYDEYEHPDDYDINAYQLSVDEEGEPKELNFDERNPDETDAFVAEESPIDPQENRRSA